MQETNRKSDKSLTDREIVLKSEMHPRKSGEFNIHSNEIPEEDLKQMKEVTEYRDCLKKQVDSNDELERADRVPNESKMSVNRNRAKSSQCSHYRDIMKKEEFTKSIMEAT